MDFISGEKLQNIADLYLGNGENFVCNPFIMAQTDKHQLLDDITGPFDNPAILFLYPHIIDLFVPKLKWLKNPFTLITHNSDFNLTADNIDIQQVLACPLLKCWWGQNLCFIHPKMRPLPIGLANAMWEHGNQEYYREQYPSKTRDIYFNFNIQTNPVKRIECEKTLIPYLGPMLPMISVKENVRRLAEYRWCICPEGNGADTHRLWEALYLGCVPVVIQSPFIDTLIHYTGGKLPIIAIESWDQIIDVDFTPTTHYDKYDLCIADGCIADGCIADGCIADGYTSLQYLSNEIISQNNI